MLYISFSRTEHFSQQNTSIVNECESRHTTCIQECLNDEDTNLQNECKNKCHAELSTCSQMKRQDKLEKMLYDMEHRENQSRFIQEYCDLNNNNVLLKQSIKRFNDKNVISVKIFDDWAQNNTTLIDNMNICKNKLNEILNYRSTNLFDKVFTSKKDETEHNMFDHDLFENLYFVHNQCLKEDSDGAKNQCLDKYIALPIQQRDKLFEHYRNIYYNYIRINQLLENTKNNIEDLDTLIDLIDFN